MLDSTENSELIEAAVAGEFQHLADMKPDDIQYYPEQQRFRAIKHIRDSVLSRSPAPDYDPRRPVCEESFATEIAALIGISSTMRHSSAYMQWLDACRSLLVYKLYHDAMYMRFIRKWDDTSLRKGAHRARERIHTEAANKTFRPIFETTKIDWFSSARRQDEIPSRRTILQGLSKSNIRTGSHTIELNTHLDSCFSDAALSNGFAHHEKVHNLGFQLGRLYAQGEFESLGEQARDGKLWCYLMQEQANIPARIKPAYRSQFHEVVAFAEGDKMEALVAEMLKPGFTPEAPAAA